MGMIQSILEPYKSEHLAESRGSEDIVRDILDEIVLEHTGLIADVEEKKVDAGILKHQIEKYIDGKKGIFDPESVKLEIFNTIYGYGKLEPYVNDKSISDIDAPRYDYVLIKRHGKIEETPIRFESESAFERFCKVLIIRHGGVINGVDTHCRVSDKTKHLRINVSIPPRNATGTALSIRKHPKEAYALETLCQMGFLNEGQKRWLGRINESQKNILICGKGGSGKTTLLRSLIESGKPCERVLICEADTEIYPQKKNTIVQHIQKRVAHHEPTSLDTLIKEGLTMSLDTYCIGEITGAEALPFVKAGHTGHRVLGTIHSKGPLDALSRLLMLIESETSLSEGVIKKMIGEAIQVIVYVKDFKIEAIVEIDTYNAERGEYVASPSH